MKIRLGEYDFEIKYLEGKQNHVADALSRIKINEVYNGSNKATAHSAEEDNENVITIPEKPINHFARQVEMIRSNTEGEESEIYFKKVKIKIMFNELNIEKAKQILIIHFCTKSSALFVEHDSDFEIIQEACKQAMNITTKNVRAVIKLQDIKNYAEFKEIIVSNHEKLLHPGIEKMVRLFKETYYYPEYHNLIQNLINECNVCN